MDYNIHQRHEGSWKAWEQDTWIIASVQSVDADEMGHQRVDEEKARP
jgi:hypothetical protein